MKACTYFVGSSGKACGRAPLALFVGLAVLVALVASCSQPLTRSGAETRSVDLGGLFSAMHSRSLNNIESARLVIQDESQTTVFDQTYTEPPPNNQITIDLVINQRYFLELTMVSHASGTAESVPLTYKKAFTMSESGSMAIDIVFPSPDDWIAFNPLWDTAIGPLIGWKGAPPNAMSMAQADIGVNGSLPSNSGTYNGIQWAWKKQGSIFLFRYTVLADTVLGASGYTMLKGSYQEVASVASPGCTMDFKFSGGVINHIFMLSDGLENGVMAQFLVNDFDYMEFMKSGPSPSSDYSSFFGADMTQLQWFFTPTNPANAYGSMVSDQMAQSSNSSGLHRSNTGTAGYVNFTWDWIGTGPSDITHLVTCTSDTVLGGSSSATVLAGSYYKDIIAAGNTMTTDFDYSLSGGVVSRFQMKQVSSPSGLDIQVYAINGVDLISNVIPVTLVLNNPSTTVTYDALQQGTIMYKPSYPGNSFMGWFKDGGFTVPWTPADKVSGPLTLYAKWTTAPIAVYQMEDAGTTVTNSAYGGSAWDAIRNGGSWNAMSHTLAQSFDANIGSAYISTPALDFGGDFTVSAWVYFITNSGPQYLFGTQPDSSIATGAGLSLTFGSGLPALQAGNGSTSLGTPGTAGNTVLANATWGRITITRSANQLQVYRDANPAPVITLNMAGNLPGVTTWTFGKSPAGTAFFNGYIDDVKIWDRAVTSAEIPTLP